MRELKSHLASHQSLAPALRTVTATGTAIDRVGFESLTFAIHVGDWTDGQHVVHFEHSDDNSDFDGVLEDDLVGASAGIAGATQVFGLTVGDDGNSPNGPTYENENALIGYIGDRQYVRPKVTISGTATGAFIGVDVILGHASKRPTE
ncbi:hypothetical protein [Mesorhizobium sp. LNJC405B00]|uniref:hypothetical protein n=1 Tax=Mesorhizobium sp. LNJC405B00 TaxID=1287281 RepID=UPI0003CF8EB7|nr:hypothetical protein [Mesorhizobium sp. LNJC405B00]ESX86995.1 hypothetical protein X755_29500 [Mesorhizobium sp. LNJC405B00]